MYDFIYVINFQKIKNKKILELGCNAGIILSSLDKSNNISGVDLNLKALKIAKTLSPHAALIKKDFFKLDNEFKLGSFDVIILSHVLPKDNYQSKYFPEELLDIVLPLLKRKGEIYLTTPSVERCAYKKNKFINRAYLIHLLNRYPLKYSLRNWCPWNIHFNKIAQFIPGIFTLLEILSKKNMRSVSFYVKATKK